VSPSPTVKEGIAGARTVMDITERHAQETAPDEARDEA
jgi:hypothetical protein